MGVVTAAQALGRLQHRLAPIPLDLFDDTVMPVLFDKGAPARLAYDWVLIECDKRRRGSVRRRFRSRPCTLRQRSAAVRYALARRQRQILRDTDAALERHRALLRARHRQHTKDTD
ncbi:MULTISPECIES: hypothetical protein [Rhodococcus]|uniref:Uncharacterized protein n=1 Tax=Rhodococcus jostii (strain RHA1) TaxID=101510 RepID=Q0S158_RHOJR|nr:hypothetical protein [Rhodococcus jostii]ABG98728.1 hypothetical protein RHA1_ro06962 [Rhodococcus jostii RHA1]